MTDVFRIKHNQGDRNHASSDTGKSIVGGINSPGKIYDWTSYESKSSFFPLLPCNIGNRFYIGMFFFRLMDACKSVLWAGLYFVWISECNGQQDCFDDPEHRLQIRFNRRYSGFQLGNGGGVLPV